MVLYLEVLIGVPLANEIFDDTLDWIPIRQNIHVVIIDKIIRGRGTESNCWVVAPILNQLLQLLTELLLRLHLTGSSQL